MNWKTVLVVASVFIFSLLIFFPYESVLRYRLVETLPALHCDGLTVSPWAGIRLTGVRYEFGKDSALDIDEIRIRLRGLLPLKWKMTLARGAGRVEALVSGSPDHVEFDVTVTNADVSQWMSSLGGDLKLEIDARATGAAGLRPPHILDGTTIVISRMTGDIPPTSQLAKAGERALGMPGWASMWGSALKEGRVEMKSSGDGMSISSLHLRTEGELSGSGEIRPVFPLTAARVRLEGQATLSGRTIPINNTFSLGGLLGGAP